MFPIDRFKDKGLLISAGIFLLTAGIYSYRNGFLGSKVDWMSQHTVFPEYFRTLFYETGNFFPNYAPHIGAGQNIYNFSYYGLLSPSTMASYLFPGIEMPVFLVAWGLASLGAAVLIFYLWLQGNGFSRIICVSVGFLFLLSGPMLFHTYQHVMFVNYMPFLCLSLIGTDRYFRSGRQGTLIISVFLMIMSSFYFSVGGIAAIILYGSSVLMETSILPATSVEPGSRSSLLTAGKRFLRFLFPILTAVLMSGVLLIPTFFALLGSGRESQDPQALLSLIYPEYLLKRYCYSPYGFGLSAAILPVLLSGSFSKKRDERLLSAVLILISVFPVFLFLLNGGLYAEEKVMIPFLPIACYLIALFLRKLETDENRFQKKMPYYFAVAILLVLFSQSQTEYWIAALADLLLLILVLVTLIRLGAAQYFPFFITPALLASAFLIQNHGLVMEKAIYDKIQDSAIAAAIREAGKTDHSFSRLDSLLNKDQNMNRIYVGDQYITSFYSSSFNQDYFDFRNDVFQLERPLRNEMMQPATQNPLFLIFMGVKYVRADSAPAGYELHYETDNVKLFRNKDAFPIGYATDQLLPETDFFETAFPYRQELLLNRAVIQDKTSQRFPAAKPFLSRISPVQLPFPRSIDVQEGVRNATLSIPLPEPAAEDQVIFLSMKIKNFTPSEDISITIQHQRNRLSAETHTYYNGNTIFHYAISVKKGAEVIEAEFSPGKYEISSFRCYALKVADIAAENLAGNPLTVSKEDIGGDWIKGTVTAVSDGFLVTSIPYDPNFKVLLDGREVPFERVNTAFIGFPISRGFHQVYLRYSSPGFQAGAAVSILGFLIFLGIMGKLRKEAGKTVIEKIKKKKLNRSDHIG